MILPKSQMTEEDIELNYITPAINAAGWQNGINMEQDHHSVVHAVNPMFELWEWHIIY